MLGVLALSEEVVLGVRLNDLSKTTVLEAIFASTVQDS